MSRLRRARDITLAEYIAMGVTTATETTQAVQSEERCEVDMEGAMAKWWQRQWMAIEAGSAEAI